jgi:hypothetical protein
MPASLANRVGRLGQHALFLFRCVSFANVVSDLELELLFFLQSYS